MVTSLIWNTLWIGLYRPGMNPIWGPLSSSGIDRLNVVPRLHARRPALHRGVVDQVERAELVVVTPAAPVADTRGDLQEVVVERHVSGASGRRSMRIAFPRANL